MPGVKSSFQSSTMRPALHRHAAMLWTAFRGLLVAQRGFVDGFDFWKTIDGWFWREMELLLLLMLQY